MTQIMTTLINSFTLIIVATLSLPLEASNNNLLQISNDHQSTLKGNPQHTLQNLILSPQTVDQLKALSQKFRQDLASQSTMSKPHHHKLRPTSVIFAGSDQKGKLAAAEALAVELTRPLLKLNVKNVIQKYIGETEKHLSSVIRKAKVQESIIFLDEADAIFGKRTGLFDTHDRYANQEINHLLQAINQYPGLIIMSTQHFPQSRTMQITTIQSIIQFPCIPSRKCVPQ